MNSSGTKTPELIRFMNSYKLESSKPFNVEKVEQILQEVLTEIMENPYDEIKSPSRAEWATATIRERIKQLEFDRYRLICIVTIGEKRQQDVETICGFLWDPDRDRFAKFSIETNTAYGVAWCFGIYFE